jgi:branched-subunit amino acid aminotransferase/4-amino-4-deoxychorismate lyase
MARLNKIIKIQLDGKIFQLNIHCARLYESMRRYRTGEEMEKICRIKFGLMENKSKN